MVFAAGRHVTDALFATRKPVAPVGLDSVKARPVQAMHFGVPVAEGETPVIGVMPGKIITEHRRYRLPTSGNQTTVDLERDIVAHMAFRPAIAADLKLMDARLFMPGPMGLAQDLAGKAPVERSGRLARLAPSAH
jgi:hypothetical protein